MDANGFRHVLPMATAMTEDGPVLKPVPAYRNADYMCNAHGAKPLRVLAELMEPEQRMLAGNVRSTILVFGSARSRSPHEHAAASARVAAALAAPDVPAADRARLERQATALARSAWMCAMYADVEALARRLTQWSMSRLTPAGGMPYIVATGGGPGMMEAANKGAAGVPGAVSIGMGITLPFEAGLNPYVTPELGLEFRYFFTRKAAMCTPCRAFIATPGGYGTFDELFEVLTLMQAGKIELAEHMPVVLFGTDFWRRVVDWDALLAFGVISERDITRLFFTDSVEDAYAHVTARLLDYEAAKAAAIAAVPHPPLSEPAQAFNKVVEDARTTAATPTPAGAGAGSGAGSGAGGGAGAIPMARVPSYMSVAAAEGAAAAAFPDGLAIRLGGAPSMSALVGESEDAFLITPVADGRGSGGGGPAGGSAAPHPALSRDFSHE
jgi:uncharacterized protein (TIGR00730 family)